MNTITLDKDGIIKAFEMPAEFISTCREGFEDCMDHETCYCEKMKKQYRQAIEAAIKIPFKDQEGTMKDCYNLFDTPYIEQGNHYTVPEFYHVEVKDNFAYLIPNER